jgi:hypothetical protein
VNKQEFSASSWRSNQGCTKMHGQPTIKICDAFFFQDGKFYKNGRVLNVCLRIDKKIPDSLL